MRKRVYAALISLAAVAAAPSFAAPAGASAPCDEHQQCQHRAARGTPRRARTARLRARMHSRDRLPAAAYVCPMHPDVRERSRGTCPKCLMDLVAEPRGAKAYGRKGRVRATGAGASASSGV